MAGEPKYRVGDWVVVESGGGGLPSILVTRLVHENHFDGYRGRGWAISPEWCPGHGRTPERWIARLATPDEIAKACFSEQADDL